jgi:hypothetical protein
MRGRTNTLTTTTSKTAVATSKRGGDNVQPARPTSAETRASSSSVSIVVKGNAQESMHPQSLRIITEVDGIINEKRVFIYDK